MLLKEFLKVLEISQTSFAERIGVSYVRLNSVVKGHRGVTPDTALRLERATGMSAGFWLNLQRDWDLWHTVHSPAAREIEQIEPLEELAHALGLLLSYPSPQVLAESPHYESKGLVGNGMNVRAKSGAPRQVIQNDSSTTTHPSTVDIRITEKPPANPAGDSSSRRSSRV